MNNFELDRRAKELAASNSGYNLARRFLMLEDQLAEARRESEQSQQAQGEAVLEVTGRSDFMGYVIAAEINGHGSTLGQRYYSAPPAHEAVTEVEEVFRNCHRVIKLVEGIENLSYGAFRGENTGTRLKDTKQWVEFYVSVMRNTHPDSEA